MKDELAREVLSQLLTTLEIYDPDIPGYKLGELYEILNREEDIE